MINGYCPTCRQNICEVETTQIIKCYCRNCCTYVVVKWDFNESPEPIYAEVLFEYKPTLPIKGYINLNGREFPYNYLITNIQKKKKKEVDKQ